MERDFDARPYDASELKVVSYLREIVPDIGAGDDPVAFLIASHAALRHDLTQLRIKCPHESTRGNVDGSADCLDCGAALPEIFAAVADMRKDDDGY